MLVPVVRIVSKCTKNTVNPIGNAKVTVRKWEASPHANLLLAVTQQCTRNTANTFGMFGTWESRALRFASVAEETV